MITTYTYDQQLKSYLKQFAAIFSGLRVMTGIGECDVAEYISVPLTYGHKDRVVAALFSGNTSNRMFSLPAMSFNLASISMSPDGRKGNGLVDSYVTLPVTGTFPEDLRTVKRVMPVAYDATIELTVYTSNTDQFFQIFEQIGTLFNPDLQLYKNDSPHDWTRITRVEMTDIAQESNIPAGTERRVISWTFTFLMPIKIGIPIAIKDDLVRKIIIQIASAESLNLSEVDDDGNLKPFGDPLARIEITDRDPMGPVPFAPRELP